MIRLSSLISNGMVLQRDVKTVSGDTVKPAER